MKVTKGSLWEASSRPTGRLFTFPPLKPMEKDLLLFWRFVKEQRVYGNYSKSLSPWWANEVTPLLLPALHRKSKGGGGERGCFASQVGNKVSPLLVVQ